jgi:hypothetical protein
MISARMKAFRGTTSDGFKTTVLPARRAGTTEMNARKSG